MKKSPYLYALTTLVFGLLIAACSPVSIIGDFFSPASSPQTMKPVEPTAIPYTPDIPFGNDCYDQSPRIGTYQPQRGIQIGQQAIISQVVALEDEVGREITRLETGQSLMILDGPWCWWTAHINHRWWRVRADDIGREGFVNEYRMIEGSLTTYLDPIASEENAACPYTDRVLDSDCPHIRQTIQASYQPFQSGFMIWRDDTRQILVFFNDGSYQTYADTWVDGEIFDVGEAAPADLLQPQFGMGKVWATQGEVRNRLGWAVAGESYYGLQLEIYSQSDGSEAMYLQALGGRFILLTGNRWQFQQ